MPNRQRSLSGENPLLGMIVDRTSFDEDDPALGDGDKASRSLDDGDSLSINSSEFGLRKTRSGKIRRKLRWKPPGFRSRRTRKSSASVMSTSEKSSRTNKSTMSFHTFHSTETPVIDNKKVATPIPMSRPNYPDSFVGVATISNEGRYVHSRMNQKSHKRSIPRSSTIPPSRHEKKRGGWDFSSLDEGDGSWESFDSESQTNMFDPYGDAISSSTGQELPPRQRSLASLPEPSTPRESPLGSKPPLHMSPHATPSTVASSVSDMSVSAFPALESDEYERRIDLLQTGSPKSPFSGADAAAGLAMPMSPNAGVKTPEKRNPKSPNRRSPRTPRSLRGKPPVVPTPPSSGRPRKQDIQRRDMPEESADESFEAVPAKVTVNVGGPSNLNTIVAYSGLLNGKHYLPQTYLPESPLTAKARESPNRSMDSSSDGLQPVDDDDSLSTRNSIRSSEVIVEDLQIPPNSEQPKPDQVRKSRKSTGPVDLDDGSFLEAEKNLRAIHDMAAEHLEHGEYVEALEVFQEILRGQKERYGPDHYRVGTALHNIGIVYLKSKRFDKAVEVCQQAVNVRRKALVANHPDVAVSLAQLGVAHLEYCQYRKALLAFREALTIRREFLGPKHPKVGKLLNNIGCALFAVDELEGAKLAFEEALEIQRETLRGDSSSQSNQILLSIASTLCNLGSIKVKWGLYEEASVALEEALLIQQSVLGDDHPAVLNTIRSIDFVDRAMRDGDDIFGEYKNLYTCQNPTEFLIPSATEDTKVVSMDCASSTPSSAIHKVMSVNLLQVLGLDKSKRWYETVEQQMLAAEEVCASLDDLDVEPKRARSPRRRRTSSVVEI